MSCLLRANFCQLCEDLSAHPSVGLTHTEQSVFSELQVKPNRLDCFAEYLAQVNAAETLLQINVLVRANGIFCDLVVQSLQCLDRLFPGWADSSKHLFENRQFITAYILASEAPENHKTMFSHRNYAQVLFSGKSSKILSAGESPAKCLGIAKAMTR